MKEFIKQMLRGETGIMGLLGIDSVTNIWKGKRNE